MSAGFSRRTTWDTGESGLARALGEVRSRGGEVIDLTVSNPTVCGFRYDTDALLGALANPAAMRYDPDPRGLLSAREAVARYYADHGAELSAADVVLTTSTSEAYSFLFRLLCDAGDEVLVAQPGYPLFDFLAGLDDVVLRTYPLFYDFGWWIDFAELERTIGPRTRALMVVHPNNPTGHATSGAERRRLEELCARYGLALIVDEVFLDYGLDAPIESFAVGPHPCCTFVLSGLSKIAALPQMKVAWVACLGPEGARREALERLEVIADTFLSLNAPVQHALPLWLGSREAIQKQIVQRVRDNLRVLNGRELVRALPVEAGWAAVLRVPRDGDETAVELVQAAGVLVHPGSFYGMPERNRIVISLIGRTEALRIGMQKPEDWCQGRS